MDKTFTVTKSELIHLLQQKHKDISYLDTVNIEYDKEKETFVCTCVRKYYEPINKFWSLTTPIALERSITHDMPIQALFVDHNTWQVVVKHKNGMNCICNISDIIVYNEENISTLTPYQCKMIFGEVPK